MFLSGQVASGQRARKVNKRATKSVLAAVFTLAGLALAWSLTAGIGEQRVADAGTLASGAVSAEVALSTLPLQARETHQRILAGGPFPYDKDGSVFFNRERLLPPHPRGHYREYTVITPGEDDRGARRIVTGADGEQYYTHDHYDSFSEIVE